MPESQTASRTETHAQSGEFTIDELARETGMTVRNIRAHQSRGLLPPPEVRARTGFYGAEHVARLRMIQDMQAEGFNLKGIERLLATNGAGEAILDFGRAVLGAFEQETPEFTTAAELTARFATSDPRFLRQAEKIGLIASLGDGRFEVPSPTLLRGGESLIALGVPVTHALAVAEKVQRQTRAIAQAFVRVFTEDLMGSRDVHALDPADWSKLREALERLRPLAADSVAASFAQSMNRAVEQQVERSLGK